MLTAETRRRIEEAWGQRVFNNYAATEAGGIAIECDQHRGMHVMEDLVMVENVDKDNQPVPPGVFGDKLLITPFYKRTQPLMRYALEDRVRFSSEPCPCGRPFKLIDAIEGRIQEVLSLRRAGGGEVSIHPLIFHNLLDMLPVSRWQVVTEKRVVAARISIATVERRREHRSHKARLPRPGHAEPTRSPKECQ